MLWSEASRRISQQSPPVDLLDSFHISISANPGGPLPWLQATCAPKGAGAITCVINARNDGLAALRGGSLTLSSPDAERIEVSAADVPILPAKWSDCNVATPHAWVLTSRTPCHTALQYNTACKKMVNLTYPMAEAWYKPWAKGETRSLQVQIWPRPGVRQVRLYARAAMLAGSTGCNLAIAPAGREANGVDQQGFPVQVITVPVK